MSLQARDAAAPPPARILVVDDSFENRDMLARRLRRRGYAVAEAASGAQALDLIGRSPPDLALLDYMMPEMSGLDLLRILRRRWTPSDLPAIMATARTDQEAIVEALSAGANDYVGKPVDVAVLVARIEAQLERRTAVLALRRMNTQLEGMVAARTAELTSANADLRREIEARIQAEHALRDAKLRAEAASTAKTRFLANASHELRTPLNAIIGFAEVLLDHRDGTERPEDEYVRAILDGGRELLGIINSIIQFVRVDSASEEMAESPVDLGALAAEASRAVTPTAIQARVSLHCAAAAGLPRIRADSRLLLDAVRRIIDNAVKFTPPGGAAHVSVARAPEGGAEIVVDDEGPGVPPEQAARLMRPFTTGDESYTRTHGGLGLGLPIARRVVERHGGRVELLASPYGGTRARVTLPAWRLIEASAAA